MKKITKKDKVENYLEDLMKSDGFDTEDLMNMTVYDLFGNAELEGIGKTTLSGSLNSFKQKHGLKKPGKGGLIPVKNTKKERVERYLTKLMKSPEFGVEDLMSLTVYDLFGNSELEGIGKTTLSSGISAFKKKYLKIQYSNESEEVKPGSKVVGDEKQSDKELTEERTEASDNEAEETGSISESENEEAEHEDDDDDHEDIEDQSFEDVIINVIGKGGKLSKREAKSRAGQSTAVRKALEDDVLSNLDREEIVTLKQMISRFKMGKMNIVSAENMELVELKHALRYFGIDYRTILEHYRKNTDK